MSRCKLYIGSPANETIWLNVSSSKCVIDNIYRCSGSRFLSAIRLFSQKKFHYFERIWIRKVALRDKLYSTIIFMDSCNSLEALKYHIRNKRDNQRYVYYYWNTVESRKIKPDTLKSLGYETWSFDPVDCKKYNMNFNPSFYHDSWYKFAVREPIKADVTFVGRDKDNRMKYVMDIMRILEQRGLVTLTYFTAPKWYKRFGDRSYKPYLSYDGVLKEELSGKAVLDCAMESQSGITLRVFDALVNGRKLITTNKWIKDYAFYNPESVFVLGDDNFNTITDFVKKPFCGKSDLSYYKFDNWVERFCIGEDK